MKRFGSVLSTAAFVLFIGSLLFSTNIWAAKVEITHLTYGGHGAEWRAFLEEQAKQFEAETDIKVNVIQVSDYTPKVASMIAGGVAPDVTDYHPAIAGALIGKGIFEDLRPYIKRDKVPLEMIPPASVKGLTTPNGAIWGLPWDTYPLVTFYNADMFSELELGRIYKCQQAPPCRLRWRR